MRLTVYYMMQMNITIGNIYKPVYVYMKRRMMMPRYLVRIESEVEVKADDETQAESIAIECFDFGSVDVDIEEIDDA